jgi:hypothetical protein
MKKYILISIIISIAFSCNNEKSPENLITRPTNPVVDGQVQIGTQIWMTKNLNVSKYSDGTPIPQVTDLLQWANMSTGAWCYYENITSLGNTFGKLYNWYAVVGIYNSASAINPALRKKLAPSGWHVPTDTEWTQLTNYLGGEGLAGGKMKAIGMIEDSSGFWQYPNGDANNESGFTGLPGGYRHFSGKFHFNGGYGFCWSSSENLPYAWFRMLSYYDGSHSRNYFSKRAGYSVRCVKD